MKLLFKKNYLTQIGNSVKCKNYLFRNFYVEKDEEVSDSLEKGKNSCAVFVCYILYSFNSLLDFLGKKHWIEFIHLTVVSTEKDLIKNEWYEIDTPKPGAILVWEKKIGHDGKLHSHIGFYIGNKMAVSNDSGGSGFPHKHHFTYNGTRKIEKIYWNQNLET